MLVASACTISPRRLLSSIHKMINDGEECPAHGGHNKLTLTFDEELFDKLEFEDWEKEKMTHSLQGKIAAAEGNVNKNNKALGSPGDNDG